MTISLKEALVLENEFMRIIDFKLFVNQKVYDKYYNYLYNLENYDLNDELEIDLN